MATKYTIQEIAKMTPEQALTAKFEEYDDAPMSESAAINARYEEGANLREKMQDDDVSLDELAAATEKAEAAIRAAHPNREVPLSLEDEIVVGSISDDGEVALFDFSLAGAEYGQLGEYDNAEDAWEHASSNDEVIVKALRDADREEAAADFGVGFAAV